MATKKKHIALRIIISALVVILLLVTAGGIWIGSNYRKIIMEKLPVMVADGSDSVYHLSVQDVSLNIFTGNATITGLKVWPDKAQAKALRSQRRQIPTTLSTVSAPAIEIYGISWVSLVTTRSLNCNHVVVHNLKWTMEANPHPEDSLFTSKKKGKPMILRVKVAHGDILQPEITYEYEGTRAHFSGTIMGGTDVLHNFVYDTDQGKDTSNFLYANSGSIRPDSFIFKKKGSRYLVKKPLLDFETGERNIMLKGVKIANLTNTNEATGKVQEVYNLAFPDINITGTNWNKLINDGILKANDISATKPLIDVRYISENSSEHSKMGDYPNQQLHEIALKTNIQSISLKDGLFRFTQPVEKSNQEGVIELEDLNCHLTNVANTPHAISRNNNCTIKLKAKYNHKSNVAGTINLTLGAAKGHFTLDGYLENLDAADITKQTQAFALFAVTSLHMSKVSVKLEGDESYVGGDLTMLYQDLKISFLKFNSNLRKNKRGPLSFIANTVILYPQNPMPHKDIRTVSTTFARDTTKGFVSMIWENILRGAQKTAIRSDALINIVDGPESTKGEKPKKGIFKRLFGKKH